MNYYKDQNSEINLKDGICRITFYAEELDFEIADSLVKNRLSITQDKTYPMLSDIRLTKSFSKEARARLSDKESEIGVNACAIILKSKAHLVLFQFFTLFSSQKIPTKFFLNVEEGAKWLEQYKLN